MDLTSKQQAQHALVAQLMSGALGELFHGYTFEQVGPTVRPLSATAYLALYWAESDSPTAVFVALEATRFTARMAAKRVQAYELVSRQAQGIFLEVDPELSSGETPHEAIINELTVRGARTGLGGYDLPIALVTFSLASDITMRKAVFWYPVTASPDKLLSVFQANVAAAYGV